MKNRKVLAVALALIGAQMIAVSAEAGELRVRCEQRGTRRSKVSVDGRNVAPGSYVISLTSGSNSAPQATVTVVAPADEFEVDYDSNRADIRRGAIAISPTFIQNGTVSVIVTGAENLSANNVSCTTR
ncbi:MAG TPA: hypothetical protein VNM15_03495 [Candidatus Binatia bacterium]|nr:hypothetical protein [Candidatus Binatia bacterium]